MIFRENRLPQGSGQARRHRSPFPHTPFRKEMEEQGRILHNDWIKYTCGEVAFQPKLMTVDSLQKMYHYAWDTFYSDCCQEIKMAKLFMDVIKKEKADGTFKKQKLTVAGR